MELIVDNLSHQYADLKVLEDINLTITSGRIVTVIGPSGCGKSTLLKMLGGLEEPSQGEVNISGESSINSLNPLTYVFQDFALLPWRSVAKNISLVLEDHNISKSERDTIISDVLARTNLSDFGNALPRQLSGGMRQRVALARALAVRPEVLLLDEPLSALDSQTKELLMDDLIDLWSRENTTAVYVTHNLNEAVRLGHQIVVLSRRPGKIRETIKIDSELIERRASDPKLIEIQEYLWRMMRDEVVAADMELNNG
jgi:NitT/TauT family transport system ATP-binding protein